ncbi:hypothetical protein [Nonomuraea jabiensis]
MLRYLEDWGPTLAELRRVLRPAPRLGRSSVRHRSLSAHGRGRA